MNSATYTKVTSLLLVSSPEDVPVFAYNPHVWRLVLKDKVGISTNGSAPAAPQHLAVPRDDQVAIILVEEGEVLARTVASGRSDSDTVLVGDNVAVSLEDDADTVHE